MPVPSHPTLIRRMLDRRLKQLAPAGPLLAASLAQMKKRCGQPSGSGHHGGPLHAAHHLTVSAGGKTRTVDGPQDRLTAVQQGVHEPQRLKSLIPEISQLTLALIQGHVAHRKRRRGRR
jgi:hypothetical protein